MKAKIPEATESPGAYIKRTGGATVATVVAWQISSVWAAGESAGESSKKTVPYKIKYTKVTTNGPLVDKDIATSTPTGTSETLENQEVEESYVVKGHHDGSVLSSSYRNGRYYTVVEVYVTYGAK